MMWKRFMVMIGGAALAASLPMAAFAVTPADSTAIDPMMADLVPVSEQYRYSPIVNDRAQIQEQIQVQTQEQDQVRKRLQVHIETGPPEGHEPIQERLRQHEQLGTGNPDAPRSNQDAPRGNPDAPMLGDGTGSCTQDGEPAGTGPHGKGVRNNG